MLVDRKFRLPRIWSNNELKKFSDLFRGDIVNISAWRDEDKEGKHYKDYFTNANSYTITNFNTEARGFQGKDGEIFLDLEKKLAPNLYNRFDVIFNHTTLEHIYDFRTAFKNICLMSNDMVIIVVPFLQQMHADYGDYWRFSPLAIKKMFEENNMQVLYSSFNEHKEASVYLFFIASKNPIKWDNKIHNKFTYKTNKRLFLQDVRGNYTGCRSIKNNIVAILLSKLWK